MENEELRDLLGELHDTIGQTESVDSKGKELLADLVVDIQELLARSEGDQVKTSTSTLQRLEIAIDHFEVTHPSLAATMSQLLTVLANAGI